MKKILASLLLVGFIAGCQSNAEKSGNCNLGAKSSGVVSTSEAECRNLGGRYTG